MSRKVTAEVYDGRPYTEAYIARARCEVDGVPHGCEVGIPKGKSHKAWTRYTILILYRRTFGFRRFFITDYWRVKLPFLKGSSNATKPREPEEETQDQDQAQ